MHDYAGTQYPARKSERPEQRSCEEVPLGCDTITGRFNQQDSYTGEYNQPQSLNRYTYVWNNPSKYIDPSGHRLMIDGEDVRLNNVINKGDQLQNNIRPGGLSPEKYADIMGQAWDRYNHHAQVQRVDVQHAKESEYEVGVESFRWRTIAENQKRKLDAKI